MPGRVFLTHSIGEVASSLGAAKTLSDEPPRFNIAPGQEVVALTDDGLTRMRWGLIPMGRVNARGRPVLETVVNARSETLFDKSAFEGVRRAVLPVSGWYEWTGKPRRKTAWRIRPKDGGLLFFAAIWDDWSAPGGAVISQLATVTCAPSADVESIHHRMAVILSAEDAPGWLGADEADLNELMNPWPAGRLIIESADDVNWDGA